MHRLLGALLGACLLACGLMGAAHATPALYVYRWGGQPANLAQFRNMRGGVIEAGVDDFNDFTQTAANAASNADWDLGQWQGQTPDVMYAVGLCFKDMTLAQVAAGAADATYAHIGQSLVGHGFAHARVRLGHEMNGGWCCWGQKGPAYAAAFNHVAPVIKKACPGCTIVFNPASGIDPTSEWPGPANVDAMGWDDYENTWNSGGATSGAALIQGDINGYWGFASGFPIGGRGWWTNRPGGAVVPEFGIGSRSDGHGACTKTGATDCDDATGMAQSLAAFTAGGVGAIGYWDVNAGDYNSEISGGERPGEAIEFLKVYGSAQEQATLIGATLYTGTAYKLALPAGYTIGVLAQLPSGDVEQIAWGSKAGQTAILTDLTKAASLPAVTASGGASATTAPNADGSATLTLTFPATASQQNFTFTLSKARKLGFSDSKGGLSGALWAGGQEYGSFVWGQQGPATKQVYVAPN